MTEEEAIRQYLMQTDPLARGVNDYGQGSGFLNLKAQPESWDRLGEKNDLYGDFFRTTGTYLDDWIPDLYQEQQDPGIYQGYQSDKAAIFEGNPAYAQLQRAMETGATFEQAVAATYADPEFKQYLPADPSQWRESAESFVGERGREDRERSGYDAEKAAYDDFVKTRSGWDLAPGREREDVLASMPQVRTPSKSIGGAPSVVAEMGRRTALAAAGRQLPTPEATAERGRRNDNRMASYEALRAKKEAIQNPSKKQDNNAKRARWYNAIMYGEV
jgi:hypothetical protein